MMTFTGKIIDPFDIDPEQVCIEDIAHHLALTLRYGGGTKWPLSVARHCVLMTEEGMPGDPLTNLLHDAWEAYGGDVVSGIKSRLLVMGKLGYPIPLSSTEENGMERIYDGLGLPQPTESYKMSDMIMLSAESQVLLADPDRFAHSIEEDESSLMGAIEFQSMGSRTMKRIPYMYNWEDDERLFLNKYSELTSMRKETA